MTTFPVRQTPRRPNDECKLSQDDIDEARINAKRQRFQQYDLAHNKYYTGTKEERKEIQFVATICIHS